MEMTETGDGLCFQNNYWAKFVEDNSITNGDCLVFPYGGYGRFDFALFDQFGCEKIVVRDAQPQDNKEVKEEKDDDVVVNDNDDNDNDGDDNGDNGDDSNFINEKDKTEVENYGCNGDEEDNNVVIEEDKNEVEEDDEEEIPFSFKESVGVVVPKKVKFRNCLKKVWSMEMTETGDGLFFQNNWAKFMEDNSITNGDCLLFSYGGYALFDDDHDNVNDYGDSGDEGDDSNFVNEDDKTEYIPMDVIKDYNIALPPTLILRDTIGQEWKSKVKNWRDGRTWLSSEGWQSLCRVNLVDKDDICICEFVHQNTNDMFLQITIVGGQTTKST
ncbi:B3 domain-containing protein REM20-like [Ipomoea triloba]|uniref:B3 domain-containing protein REM20-like n=1 Tax=Ipomoea triloba TaxID=35885 RepID=UPI00125D0AB6|nr:B3 domain-containing protein REM20-like [Ipomoea triloba]